MVNFFTLSRGISILGVLFLGILLIFALSYFGISIRAIVENPDTQDNFSYVSGAGRSVWNDYLKEPLAYLWNDVWLDIFWKSFILNMERIRDGEPTELQGAVPTVSY